MEEDLYGSSESALPLAQREGDGHPTCSARHKGAQDIELSSLASPLLPKRPAKRKRGELHQKHRPYIGAFHSPSISQDLLCLPYPQTLDSAPSRRHELMIPGPGVMLAATNLARIPKHVPSRYPPPPWYQLPSETSSLDSPFHYLPEDARMPFALESTPSSCPSTERDRAIARPSAFSGPMRTTRSASPFCPYPRSIADSASRQLEIVPPPSMMHSLPSAPVHTSQGWVWPQPSAPLEVPVLRRHSTALDHMSVSMTTSVSPPVSSGFRGVEDGARRHSSGGLGIMEGARAETAISHNWISNAGRYLGELCAWVPSSQEKIHDPSSWTSATYSATSRVRELDRQGSEHVSSDKGTLPQVWSGSSVITGTGWDEAPEWREGC